MPVWNLVPAGANPGSGGDMMVPRPTRNFGRPCSITSRAREYTTWYGLGLHDIPVAKEIVIKFDGDEDAGIPGIISGAKKETEEQNTEEDKEYQKILNSVEDIKNATNAEEVSKNYGDTKEKVDKAVDQIQNNIKDQEIKDLKKTTQK